jgi:hypothetical protein
MWMERILGKVEKFRPTKQPEPPRPTVVLDRRPPSRSMSLKCVQIDPSMFESIGIGGNAHMNFLAVAMKERRMLKKKQAEETMQMLEEVRRKNEEEMLRQERKRIAVERRKLGGKTGSSSQSRSATGNAERMADQIPLELLPTMHPSHQGFRGLHPLFGRAEVSGFLPEQSAAYSVPSSSSSSYGRHGSRLHNSRHHHHQHHTQPKPASAFDDADRLLRERNATPLPRSALGVTATRGTYTSQKTLQRRRQRYSQILLGDTPAGKALFTPMPGQTPPATEGHSRPVTMQRTRSGRVGIFDPETMEQLVPAIQHAEPRDYLTLASDETLRQRGSRGVYLDHQRMRDRTLSEIKYQQQQEQQEQIDEEEEEEVLYDMGDQQMDAAGISRSEDLDFLTESIFHL